MPACEANQAAQQGNAVSARLADAVANKPPLADCGAGSAAQQCWRN
jgi:hypothetical protein